MAIDHEKFAKISAGVQSAVVSIGLIVGGIWAYYAFSVELRVENARAQLEKLKRDLSTRPVLIIGLEAKQLAQRDGYYIVEITATIRNSGTEDTNLDLGGTSPIRMTQVVTAPDGTQVFGKTFTADLSGTTLRDQRIDRFSSIISRVGAEVRVSAVLSLKNPGVYLVEFVAPMRAPQGTNNDTWLGQRYFVVQ